MPNSNDQLLDQSPESMALLAEFKAFIGNDLRLFFWQAAALSDLECPPFGNIGTLAPAALYLSLCGLPLPKAFQPWQASCTAFSPFLRGQLRFYLDAQHVFVRAIISTLRERISAAQTIVNRRGPHYTAGDGGQKPANGLRNVWLHADGANGPGRLYWHGHDISDVSTLDEWVRVSQGRTPIICPGITLKHVLTRGGEPEPFFARDVLPIEAGPNRGKLLCRDCVRPGHAAVVAHYNLTPDHPLARWLSGFVRLPDQVVPQEGTEVRDEVAGDWASLKNDDPWRLLIIESMQEEVKQAFAVPSL